MTQYYKFCCPKCKSNDFIKTEYIVKSTPYDNPPCGYNIFSTFEDEWSWASDTSSYKKEIKPPSFHCASCDQFIGSFPHSDDFIEEGFKQGYIIKYKKYYEV